MTTKVIHTSYTDKAGYVWRKRYAANTISIALQTNKPELAKTRSAQLTIRFMQLEQLDVPFESMRETLKGFRDKLIRGEKLARLEALTTSQEAPQGYEAVAAMQSPSLEQKIEQVAIERELAASQGNSLEEVKDGYFKANTEWKAKTIKDYSTCIDRFIVWCTASDISTIQAVSKDSIISFKSWMDEQGLAPLTKQKVLVRLGGMFNYAVDVKEYIQKNPVSGLMYKKVSVQTKKEEITPEQFNTVINLPQVKNDHPTMWANALMYYTGMRVSELCQLTKADYIEIEGIKCISVNTLEEGKSTKTETSIRNIPLCDKLLELGVWEAKPVMKVGVNAVMNKITQSFKLISLKRSSHCYRHSLSNRLRDTNAEDSTRAFILGHAQANITDRVYVTRAPLVKMLDALNEANV